MESEPRENEASHHMNAECVYCIRRQVPAREWFSRACQFVCLCESCRPCVCLSVCLHMRNVCVSVCLHMSGVCVSVCLHTCVWDRGGPYYL